DPFGDFDLIFGASKLNLKVVEIPIRYAERTYGSTQISRFRHGVLLLRMVVFAFRKLKAL
ncbi:MAG TPA: glycosyl transferase, partial [Alphaproteobacteria bacterium]|nr:glycosyl transferase [Alphaproteobacteria bacterium]